MRRPDKQKQFAPTPKGNHIARLYQIFHFGHVPTEYQGEKNQTDQVKLTFELCNEKKVFKEGEDPRPYSISTRDLTYSLGKKANLRKLVEGMIGVSLTDDEAYAFDIEQLIGTACLLNVVHTTKDQNTYANIQGASPLPKGMDAPPLFNEAKIVDVDSATLEQIDALPDWVKDKFKMSDEFDKRFRQAGMEDISFGEPDEMPL